MASDKIPNLEVLSNASEQSVALRVGIPKKRRNRKFIPMPKIISTTNLEKCTVLQLETIIRALELGKKGRINKADAIEKMQHYFS